MAARRKSAKRKSSSKPKAAKGKAPARKKPAPKKASGKKATPKKVTKKKAPAPKKVTRAKAPARKAAPKTPPIEALARKLIQGTMDPAKMDLEQLYAGGVVSRQPRREPAVGLAGMRKKFSDWASMTRSASWKVRNSFIKQNTICIEWQAQIELKDGRRISLEEVSLHQVKGGKIVEERYYYDPSILESRGASMDTDASPEESLLPRAPVAPPISEPEDDLLDADEPSRRELAPFEDEEDMEEPDLDPLDL